MVTTSVADGRGQMTETIFCRLKQKNQRFRISELAMAFIRKILTSALPFLLLIYTSGCSTPTGVATARQNFYMGNLERAALCLTNIPPDESHNKVLMLMERGTIRQAARDYDGSAQDWQKAAKTIEQLDYYSVSKGSTSLLVNDNVLAFRGTRYERTLLHTMNAQNYLALSKWDDAAVEARNIVKQLKDLNGFPDDPFSRYVAAVCFEIDGDIESAKIEYRRSSALLTNIVSIEETGHITLTSGKTANIEEDELICFIFTGRIPSEMGGLNYGNVWMPDPYSEIYTEGRLLGRSYTLANTGRLLADTQRRLAALQLAKDVTRIVLKEAIAESIERKDPLLGNLVRLILFALEAPDLRRWETLPLTLQVARVPCPPNLREYTVVFKDSSGRIMSQKTVSSPISNRGKIFVSLCRDL